MQQGCRRYQSAGAKRLAQELVTRDNVDILAGFSLTPNALAAADISGSQEIHGRDECGHLNHHHQVTLHSESLSYASAKLRSAGSWAFKNGAKKVYTMVSDYGPGLDAESSFQLGLKEAGGEIVGSVRMPVANPDFSAFVQRAKDLNPEGIFIFVPGGAQPAGIAKALAERGLDPKKIKIMGQGELADETALKAIGDAGIGIVTAFHYDYMHNSPLNKQFVSAFNAEFKRNPDFFAVGGYDGAHLIYEALKKAAGKTDGESLVTAAKGMKWESPRGPISIDPQTRDIINTVYIRRVEK